ncbi:MAG TPA: M23 family metallopeptidase [bacterium]|nr:M23 family metallopeptidase [bacterium]
MPYAGLFGAASMLLAVVLALVPLTLASGSAGSALYLQVGPAPAGAADLETNGLRRDREGVANRAEDVATGGGHEPAVAPSQHAAPLVLRRGGSPLRAARPGVAIQAPATTEAWNSRKQVRLAWPLRGPVTSGFGWRTHPIFGTREFHTGIDIAGRSGAPIVAAYSGTVRFVGWKSGYGQLVIVDHGHGLQTAYSHLSAATVRPGAVVEQGQEIGRTGSTGWSTGPHLLFEVWENGIPRNPWGYLLP